MQRIQAIELSTNWSVLEETVFVESYATVSFYLSKNSMTLDASSLLLNDVAIEYGNSVQVFSVQIK